MAAQARSLLVQEDPWEDLRRFTDARIGRGRCGVSLPLREVLAFRLDHARARDAVWTPFDAQSMADALCEGLHDSAAGEALLDVTTPCLSLRSQAADRGEYLMRPDKGRRLDAASRAELAAYAAAHGSADVCVVISDGLSARAAHESAVPFTLCFLEALHSVGLSVAPVCLVRFGRVAVADEVAELLGAGLVVDLLGERPGLSSPDSLGVYMTYAPAVGTTDESRNCISNVRAAGLPVAEAVRKLCYLVQEAFARRLSGVNLKDDMPSQGLEMSAAVESPRSPLPCARHV